MAKALWWAIVWACVAASTVVSLWTAYEFATGGHLPFTTIGLPHSLILGLLSLTAGTAVVDAVTSGLLLALAAVLTAPARLRR